MLFRSEQKGITYLLQAMPQVIKSFPDIILVIAGDGELKSSLQNEAKELGVTDNVLLLGARLDIPELLKLFDIYVLPSLWEGMPMVLLEAMAAGCPVVATDVGGVSKVITDGENGLLAAPEDPQQLVDGVIKLLSNSDLRQLFIENGLRKFKKKFSSDKMTQQYERLYHKDV